MLLAVYLGAVFVDAGSYELVDDGWAGVLAGSSSSMAFLNLLESMTAETDRAVWRRELTEQSHEDPLDAYERGVWSATRLQP